MNIEIANRLVELRKANNLSQEALAEKLGISRQAVSKWERAEASPDTDNLILLAKLYGVSLDDLLKTEEEVLPASAYEETDTDTETEFTIEPEMESKIEFKTESEMESKMEFKTEFPIGLLAAVIYIIIGVCFNLWHPGWLIFLWIPIISSALEAIAAKRADKFAYPVFVVFLFLYLGFVKFLWHPAWVLFLTIPIYYECVKYFTKK